MRLHEQASRLSTDREERLSQYLSLCGLQRPSGSRCATDRQCYWEWLHRQVTKPCAAGGGEKAATGLTLHLGTAALLKRLREKTSRYRAAVNEEEPERTAAVRLTLA